MRSKTLTLTLAALLVAALPWTASAQDDRAQRQFQRLDRNGDGSLTPDELPPRARQNFRRADANDDGVISAQELAKLLQRRQGRSSPDAPKPTPSGISITSNIPYAGTNNTRQTLDLLIPEQRSVSTPLPVIAFIHGGGWRAGDKSSGMIKVAGLVQTGRYAAVSIAYRLSDEATWPAQIHDCKAAIRWIRANAATHGLDGNLIATYGTSAGGHLAAMLGVTGDTDELDGSLGDHTDQSSAVTCVVDCWGPADLLDIGNHPSRIDHNASGSPESLLLGGPIPQMQDLARQASPVAWATAADAPHLIIHGTNDRSVPFPQSATLHDALEAAGASAALLTIDGGEHGMPGPSMEPLVRPFLDHHLHGMGNAPADATIPAAALSGR